jgi:hypothetical protein
MSAGKPGPLSRRTSGGQEMVLSQDQKQHVHQVHHQMDHVRLHEHDLLSFTVRAISWASAPVNREVRPLGCPLTGRILGEFRLSYMR